MKELDELELDGLAEALEGEGYDVGAIRVRQAKELIISLESQVTRLKELCGDGLKIIKDLENNNIFSHKAVADFEQCLKDDGVVK